MEKWGAEFVSPWHEHSQTFEFADAWDKSMPFAYQVRRSEFDEILIRNAARKGAKVIEGCRVRDVEFAGRRGRIVRAEHDDGRSETWQCRFLVDASGRDTFLGNRFKAKQRNPKHNSCRDLRPLHGRAAPRGQGGGQHHHLLVRAWLVLVHPARRRHHQRRRGGLAVLHEAARQAGAHFFLDTIATCPAAGRAAEDAELVSEVEATGNFSYICDRTHGPNYLLLGDAYAFIDPVFSSGVMLAMNSAFVGADAVDTCLRQPAKARAGAAAFDQVDEARAEGVFLVHLPRHQPHDARPVHVAAQRFPGQGGAAVGAGRRHLRQDADLAFAAGIQGDLLPVFSLANLKRTILAWKRRKLNIRYVEDAEGPAADDA